MSRSRDDTSSRRRCACSCSRRRWPCASSDLRCWKIRDSSSPTCCSSASTRPSATSPPLVR
eukprot:scaffold131050_cov60-Phaeocystis_antarctica.AAC.5